MLKYHFYLSKKKTDAYGLAPVYIKITFAGKIYERSARIKCYPQQWSSEFKRITGNAELNLKLNELEAKLALAQKTAKTIHCIDTIIDPQVPVRPNLTFAEAINCYIKSQSKLVGIADGLAKSTYKTYLYKQKNILQFLEHTGRANVLPDLFTASIGVELREYLHKLMGFKISHVNKHIKFCKTVLKWAHYEHNTQLTNFMATRIKNEPISDIVYLSNKELQAIEQHHFKSVLLQKAADLFLMQCYTGMSYCDVVAINIDMVKIGQNNKPYLIYRRGKTKVKGIVPMCDKAVALMHKYGYAMPTLCNQVYNRLLKEIAELCCISKHLTTHVGRKTFATLQLNAGYTAEAVTRMLAKTNVRETTRIYADVII
jgi:site-specific recombinase XerD